MKSTIQQFDYHELEPIRLDKYLAEMVPSFSRVQLQNLIESGKVTVDGIQVIKSAYKINANQSIRVELPETEEKLLLAQDLPLEVIYQDTETVVINKPAGLIVHPGAGHDTGTVDNGALARWPEMRQVGDPVRPGVVHRLDKDTSGVLLLARTQDAYTWYVKQFKYRKTEKIYETLVDGLPPTPTGRIETYIGRDPRHRQRMAVVYEGHGRKAITDYQTILSFDKHAFLEVHPLTGRTHQIRVQLAYLGCPVTGDKIYGRRKSSMAIGRFFLHAARLRICLPDERIATEFQAKLPDELKTILTQLGAS